MMHIRPEVLAQQKMAEKSISSHSGSANLHIDGEKVFLGVVGNFQKTQLWHRHSILIRKIQLEKRFWKMKS